jgi:cell shape-determining protein MreC
MSYIKFNHVFAGLMLLSALSAFVLNPNVTNPARAQVQNLFAPVAWPTRALAGWVHDKIRGRAVIDVTTGSAQVARGDDQIRRQNSELLQMVSSLAAQLEELKQRDAERGKLGDRRELCTPFAVFGGDSGVRESLQIQGSSFQHIAVGMPVLYPNGVVGQVSRAGAAGASVRLITDAGFCVSASFVSFRKTADDRTQYVPSKLPQTVLEGVGNGVMVSRMLNLKDVKELELKVGDYAVVDDADWPPGARGWWLGRVTSVSARRDAPMLADIRVEPLGDLSQLREVMVMNK